MTTISAELSSLLKSMDYPAHKYDLVREAARDGICESDYQRLARMVPRTYSGRFDVLRELKSDRAPLFTGAPELAFA